MGNRLELFRGKESDILKVNPWIILDDFSILKQCIAAFKSGPTWQVLKEL